MIPWTRPLRQPRWWRIKTKETMRRKEKDQSSWRRSKEHIFNRTPAFHLVDDAKTIILEACPIWYEEESRWMQKRRMTSSTTSNLLLHLHCRIPAWLNICLLSSAIYRVDEDTDVLTEEQAVKHWAEFEMADFEELKQFHGQKVFVKVRIDEQPSDVVFVDATWVRKFKRNAPGSSKPFKAKSRLCARGFLDPQKSELPTRSTTATRLSQRIIMSTAATHDLEVASWDVAGAFLKGFSFDKVRQILQKKGIQCPKRRVVVIPPPNVWRHLSKLDNSFAVKEEEFGQYGLECLKPAYGLNDAPLAWQLCLHETLRQSGGQQSSLDDCFWWWKDHCGALQAVLTTHVDDIAVAGTKAFMDKTYKMLCDRFGKVALQEMPFTHCGCRYSRVPQELKTRKKCPSLTVAVGTVVYLKNWRLTSRSLRRQWRCRSLRTPRTRIACSPRRRQRSSEAFLEDFFGLRRHAWT